MRRRRRRGPDLRARAHPQRARSHSRDGLARLALSPAGAEFIAAVQIIVYAGAIMVLFVFVIMLLNAGAEERTNVSKMAKSMRPSPGSLPDHRSACYWMVRGLRLSARPATLAAMQPSRHARTFHAPVPALLFPFELTSILILIAILGAVVLAKREFMNWSPFLTILVLSAILSGLGVVAFVFKRNIITIFMAIELMLNAVNLAFVTFDRMRSANS